MNQTRLKMNCSVEQIEADPGLCIPYLGSRIREKRWFAEKDAAIENITIEDTFPLPPGDRAFSKKNDLCSRGIIARFQLKGSGDKRIIKFYFIPLILSPENIREIPEDDRFELNLSDGKRYLFFAEHSPAFQNAVIRQYRKSGVIRTWGGGAVRFRPIGSALTDIDETCVTVRSAGSEIPSSNVLTLIQTSMQTMVSKTYKDVRGISVQNGSVWLPNPEVQRYEALAAAAYPNIPALYGVACYQSPKGEETPLNIMMEAVSSEGQVGEVFARSLAQLTEELERGRPDAYVQQYMQRAKGIQWFSAETAKTVARMHTAFSASGKAGFTSEQAASDDLFRWSDKILDNFEQAMTALKKRTGEEPNADALANLTKRLDSGRIAQRILSLRRFKGVLMKSQVHGDLHGDQGLIRTSGDCRKTDELLNSIQQGEETEIRHQASRLAAMIRWLDFEGPPAKEYVNPDYDSRENPLTDLAGMIQAFWYMLNIKLYDRLGLTYQNPDDHEKQREVSLALAGQLAWEDADIPGVNNKFIRILNLWHTDVTTSFINGYLDEIEKQNAQNSVLREWDRETARDLTYYWVLARAVHELRYETYGRAWGWEAIPGSRIIQLSGVLCT
ncbi:hypothetical protein QUF72_00665 [Desulfobacterales bacterium HSG2]|nr:hypothetical protein [Desulfobacterales bacterium HSG2]MDM8548548.1 hypothetical protein [Desulfobacterales bacterium HSG2]